MLDKSQKLKIQEHYSLQFCKSKLACIFGQEGATRHRQGRSQDGGPAALGAPPQTPGRLRRKIVAGGSDPRPPLGLRP
ncbi:MAG: hypothetical protein GY696_14690 [Gammaproteobacteria bacterium]|nr:hypothetical protein [Gammaproteobacteria bacterium]